MGEMDGIRMGGYWIIGRGPLDPVSRGQEKYLFFPIVELSFLDWIGIQEKKRNHLQDYLFLCLLVWTHGFLLFCGLLGFVVVALCLLFLLLFISVNVWEQ